MQAPQHIEFSRKIAVEGITVDRVRTEEIAATPEECAELATRFDIRGLSNFKAKINIRRVVGGKTIKIDGNVSADVVQACVVSLQDVPAHVEGTFETFFSEEPVEHETEMEFAYDDDETAPEMIENGYIDLGELSSQYLALELDPYPRAPGVSLAAQLAGSGISIKANPFQILEGLKDKDKSKK